VRANGGDTVATALIFVSISAGLCGSLLLALLGQGLDRVIVGYPVAGLCAALALMGWAALSPRFDPIETASGPPSD
jgi:uncharacterized membrane protein YhhN